MLARPRGGPNPYKIHGELGRVMTKAATVIRHNDEMRAAYAKVCELQEHGRLLLDRRHEHLGQSDRALRPGAGRHVPHGQGDPARRRSPATSAAARISSPSLPSKRSTRPIRPSAAARPRRGSITSRPTTASGSSRRWPSAGPRASLR